MSWILDINTWMLLIWFISKINSRRKSWAQAKWEAKAEEPPENLQKPFVLWLKTWPTKSSVSYLFHVKHITKHLTTVCYSPVHHVAINHIFGTSGMVWGIVCRSLIIDAIRSSLIASGTENLRKCRSKWESGAKPQRMWYSGSLR